MGRLGPRSRVVGRIGSEVRVSVSFQIIALRILLHFAGGYLRGRFSVGRNRGGRMFPVGYLL